MIQGKHVLPMSQKTGRGEPSLGLEMAETCLGEGGPVLKAWDKGSQLEGAGGPREWGVGTGLETEHFNATRNSGSASPPLSRRNSKDFKDGFDFEIDL